MDEQRRRPRPQLVAEPLAGQQPAGEAEHAGARRGTAVGHVQRHHRALAEPHQREVALGEPQRREPRVDIGVERVCGPRDAIRHASGRAVAEAEPLPARGCHVAGLRRVRRGEAGVRQEPPPGLGEADQVVAVGAQPVQQQHELAGRAACRRRPFRSRQGAHALSPQPVVKDGRIMAARPARHKAQHACPPPCRCRTRRRPGGAQVEIIFFSIPTPAAMARSYSSGRVAESWSAIPVESKSVTSLAEVRPGIVPVITSPMSPATSLS